MPTDHDQPEQFDSDAYYQYLEACARRGETVVVSPRMAKQAGVATRDPVGGLKLCLDRVAPDPSRIHVVRFPR